MSHELWKRLQLFQVLLVGKQVETSIFFALYCGNAPHNLVGKEYNMESPWKNLTQSKHSVQCFLAFQTGLMCTLHIYKANLLRASALWAGRIQYSGCPFTHVRMLSLFFLIHAVGILELHRSRFRPHYLLGNSIDSFGFSFVSCN